ncbi:hypothetical protein ACFY0A_38960 [Streptomyces sp. NPDC001698]|uniref:hypothetical protein n=1 Tax=Streptomyces sp. NPDC001698 TaxID=3364601 RepID=UPI0036BA0CCE
MRHQMIASCVSLDDMLGPYDCQLDPTNRWNGWMSPYFTLDVARELSAQTLREADEYGYDCYDTIHVIDGRADSRDTVHILASDIKRNTDDDEDGDREPLAVAVRINWGDLDQGAEQATTIAVATRAARKAARRRKPNGKGATRTVVVHVRWQWVDEGEAAADVIEPNRDGLYGIGGWEWTWSCEVWWCPRCGGHQDWHETDCLCGLTRPATPLGIATWTAGAVLHDRVPEATSALVDLTNSARVCAVFADEREIDTADDTGPFDTETLGTADQVLRRGFDHVTPADLAAAGWEHVPDKQSAQLYRITFPAARQ